MKKLILLVSLLLPTLGYAQSYSIDWSKIAGGGGTSSGGNYSLTGTIGQYDAGKMTGGNYTLDAGFLSGIVLVQTTGAPALSIQFSNGSAVISWAADASIGFVLEEAINLNAPIPWGISSAIISTNGNIKSAAVSATGIKFYRLRK